MPSASGTLRIETPAVFAPLLHPSRYKGIFGGRGGAKSTFFAERVIKRCMLRPSRIVCVREVQQSLEQSVMRLLEDTIKKLNVGSKFNVMHAHIETPGDGMIIFRGMKDSTAESIKSLEGFDVCWVEEAQSLSARSLELLRPTIRKESCRYCYFDKEECKKRRCTNVQGHQIDPSEIWCSWNPRNATDPVDMLLRGPELPPDAIVVESNWRDNPWFPDVLRREMEYDRRRDPEKYQHVWEGGYERNAVARVFKNWREEEFETPDDTLFYFGGDWGFSVDPTVLIRCWAKIPPKDSPERGTIYIDQEAYQIGCEIDHTPALFDTIGHGMARNWTIVADSARPETISYLKRNGYPKIEPAIKGANSVKEGVIFLQSYDIVIHPRCKHTIDEFTNYRYKCSQLAVTRENPDGVTPILEDRKNHVIDSVRYSLERLRNPKVKPTW
jgi:phage terminase large subunit